MAISLLPKLILIILIYVTHAQMQCVEHEKTLLLELKNQLVFNSSHSTKLVQWNQTIDDCCKWKGVDCDGAGHVVSLHLHDDGISGGLNDSSSLFSLNYLEELNLADNFLSGSLPYSISNLDSLSNLNLSNCKFSGKIPFTLNNLTGLSYLNLSHNLFTGSISYNHFEGLSNVVHVDLSYNSLNGSIPISIFALPSLKLLDLHHNQFGGQVNEFPTVNISNLSYLDLSSNQLESPIHNSFFKLQTLEDLYLSHNLFNDTFQLEKIILSLPHLRHLDLSRNNLSLDATSTPSSPNNLSVKQSSLVSLDLSHNKIDGEIPSWIWEIGNGSLTYLNLCCNMLVDLQKPYYIPVSLCLHVLDLHSNKLRGELPSLLIRAEYVDYSNNYFDKSIANLESFSTYNLQFLSIANNSLSGPFPIFICNCINLQVLDLSANNLSGSIPSCLLENIMNLKVLNLGRNNISGRIPDKFSLNCSLRTLDLSDNNFVGDVPLSLKNCTSLAFMNVGNNHINDSFPCMLPSSLQLLVLRSNRFHGEVRCHKSWPNLQIIDISSNSFSGYLNLLNFSSWRGMTLDSEAQGNLSVETIYLNHSHRIKVPTVTMQGLEQEYYTDEVMLTIKGLELKLFKISKEYTFIDFSCNNFTGYIPEAIGDLNSLHLLNLSHNALTGAIPKSFSKLRQLESLDLSMNLLTGEIPQEIVGLTFLQMMNVSHNKLVGKIPFGTQIQSFSADCFEGNTGLCGLPLNISCTSGAIRISPPKVRNVELEIEWYYVFAAAGYVVGLGSFSWLLLFCPSLRDKYFEKVDIVFDKIIDCCEQIAEMIR